MSQLTVDVSEASIGFSRDGKPVAILPRTAIDAEGLTLFQNQNYQLMGTVSHQMYLEGVYAGLQIALGPPNPALVEMANSEARNPDPKTSDLDLYVAAHPHKFGPDGEFVNDSPKELESIAASEVGAVEGVLLEPVFSEEIIVTGITVHDGVIVHADGSPIGGPATAAEVPTATEEPAKP